MMCALHIIPPLFAPAAADVQPSIQHLHELCKAHHNIGACVAVTQPGPCSPAEPVCSFSQGRPHCQVQHQRA